MTLFGLAVIDVLVLALYFAVIVWIGWRAMKHIHNQEDYFLGGRRFGKLLQIFSAFGQGTSADTAVGTTTTTYVNGASGTWSALLLLWSTPIYWFTSPWYRRMRVVTMGDFYEERYGSKRMAGFYALFSAIFLMSMISLGMMAVSSTVVAVAQKDATELTVVERAEVNSALELEGLRQKQIQAALDEAEDARIKELELAAPRRTFSHVNGDVLIWIICAVVFLYAVSGGLEAAVYTDMLQGIFIIILSIILIPFGLAKVNTMFGSSGVLGAFEMIHQRLPASFFDIFGSATSVDFTWYYILALSVMVTINVAVQANQMTVCGAAKDELTSRVGFVCGSFLKRICTVFWGFFGLIAVVLYSGELSNPDHVWGTATRDLLGSLNIGLVGLMIACLLAALMSTADTLMISASGVLTHNLYRPLVRGRSEQHYVWAGRVLGGLVLLGGALLATWFDSILEMLKFIWEFNAVVAATFWCGLKWRRATKPAAWASMIVAVLCFLVLPLVLPMAAPSLRDSAYLLRQTDPDPIERSYEAAPRDVELQRARIAAWEARAEQGEAAGERPETYEVGQTIQYAVVPPKRSIFWSKGIAEGDGKPRGQGLLYVDLVVVDRLIGLSRKTHAVNETIRTTIRVCLPFLVLILISLFTPRETGSKIDRFFVKMRTPVIPDPEMDHEELTRSYADPDRFRDELLFPESGLEFFKWKTVDTVGFLLAVAGVLTVIGVLYLILGIGG